MEDEGFPQGERKWQTFFFGFLNDVKSTVRSLEFGVVGVEGLLLHPDEKGYWARYLLDGSPDEEATPERGRAAPPAWPSHWTTEVREWQVKRTDDRALSLSLSSFLPTP
ncbi:uncharacterized protein BDZ83DRAFT_605107 [Colletotrichum acutatum]|uniref:Uncharacterized protein n=1 Tax=Glomerella acutata TaxID=27357 RepID=A0AAD9D0Y5_GLOAC|nr:uncharacterized protein BDZ83DRAFT_605107 [Colletotrichum acutatum]KAK1729446.1 hypothetical protein BDZ83DRAFT_605107 [Colletotrichum acutatum]